jgi:hypothetical protein
VVVLELHSVAPIEAWDAGGCRSLIPEGADDVASSYGDDLDLHAFAPCAFAPHAVGVEEQLHDHSWLDELLLFFVGNPEAVWLLASNLGEEGTFSDPPFLSARHTDFTARPEREADRDQLEPMVSLQDAARSRGSEKGRGQGG